MVQTVPTLATLTVPPVLALPPLPPTLFGVTSLVVDCKSPAQGA